MIVVASRRAFVISFLYFCQVLPTALSASLFLSFLLDHFCPRHYPPSIRKVSTGKVSIRRAFIIGRVSIKMGVCVIVYLLFHYNDNDSDSDKNNSDNNNSDNNNSNPPAIATAAICYFVHWKGTAHPAKHPALFILILLFLWNCVVILIWHPLEQAFVIGRASIGTGVHQIGHLSSEGQRVSI